MDIEQEPPSWRKLLREAPALLGVFANQLREPVMRESCGNGQPVLVLPGFLSGDITTSLLRRTLVACGFCAYGWGNGINWGARPDLLDRLARRLSEISAKHNQPVILLGWSLGGVYARELAKRNPDQIACLVTLGSPFSGDPRANNAWRLYQLVNDHRVDNAPISFDSSDRPKMHTVAVWSSLDGIVAPASARGTLDEVDEQIQIEATHMGMGSQPIPIKAIVRLLCRLAREG